MKCAVSKFLHFLIIDLIDFFTDFEFLFNKFFQLDAIGRVQKYDSDAG